MTPQPTTEQIIMMKAAAFRKALIAFLGFLGQVATIGLIPAPYDRYAQLIIALATMFGVYQVPNVSRNPDPATSVADKDAIEASEAGAEGPAGDTTMDDYNGRHQSL